MVKIYVKPLTANTLWKGQKFKTIQYKQYENEVYWNLVNKKCPAVLENKDAKLIFFLKVGLSSTLADLSNTIKAFEDILQKKYDFNDKKTFLIIAEKEIVKKNEEYIEFDFYQYRAMNWGEFLRTEFT